MVRLEMRNYNMTLATENRQKYQHYHLEKLLNINISEVKTYCLLIKNKIIEQAKLANSPLWKAFEKQTEK